MIFDRAKDNDHIFELLMVLFGILNVVVVGIVTSLEVAILFSFAGLPFNLILSFIETQLLFKGKFTDEGNCWDDPYG